MIRSVILPALVFLMASLAAVFLMATLAGASGQEKIGEFRDDFIWMKTVHGDYEEIFNSVKSAVASQNFPVVNVRDYAKSFSARYKQLGKGTLPFSHYRIIEFCNISLAIEALTRDLRMGLFMPCRITVYSPVGSDAVTLITVNPGFMPKSLKNKALRDIAQRVEKVIKAIFEDVEF